MNIYSFATILLAVVLALQNKTRSKQQKQPHGHNKTLSQWPLHVETTPTQ